MILLELPRVLPLAGRLRFEPESQTNDLAREGAASPALISLEVDVVPLPGSGLAGLLSQGTRSEQGAPALVPFQVHPRNRGPSS